MFEISVQANFSSAHRLRGYQGKCEDLHGHNWKVQIVVRVKNLDKIGLAVDFKILKNHLSAALDSFDHKYLNDLAYFKRVHPVRSKSLKATAQPSAVTSNGVNPTSENIARYIYEKLVSIIEVKGVKLKEVTVWESENSHATFTK